MHLHRVPPEILFVIIRRAADLDHYTSIGRKPNLYSLSLCSKLLHTAVEPHFNRS